MFNIHHLELFYFVARHQGISEAVRNIPYGIQQPAVSSQILQLEQGLGKTLFHRRPFSLTPEGQELFSFIEPFFSQLPEIEAKLKGHSGPVISVGASAIVLREYLPAILLQMRQKYPGLKCRLRDGLQPDIEGWLLNQEIQLGITVLDDKPPTGIQLKVLIELPVVLLVPDVFEVRKLEDLWDQKPGQFPLIAFPEGELLNRQFQRWLHTQKMHWPVSIHVNSVDLMETYVQQGFGIGVCLSLPGKAYAKGVKSMPLPWIQPMQVGALWLGSLNSIALNLLENLEKLAKAMR